MTQLEAIKDLSRYDHCFMGKEYCDKLSKIFGFKIKTYIAHSDPSGTFKGLSLHDKNGNPIDKSEGQDADRIATQIADGLKVEYREMFGRGSMLREACEQVEKFLNN